ncbi:MAG: hypothetical protein WBX01_04090 [Nitrososphaeraceae archaeon]
MLGFLTGFIAAAYGLKPYPFYLGIAFSLLGFIVSVILIKDTSRFTELELRQGKREQLKREQQKNRCKFESKRKTGYGEERSISKP